MLLDSTADLSFLHQSELIVCAMWEVRSSKKPIDFESPKNLSITPITWPLVSSGMGSGLISTATVDPQSTHPQMRILQNHLALEMWCNLRRVATRKGKILQCHHIALGGPSFFRFVNHQWPSTLKGGAQNDILRLIQNDLLHAFTAMKRMGRWANRCK